MFNTFCPDCRKPAYIGFTIIECPTVGCRGYSSKIAPASISNPEWIPGLGDLVQLVSFEEATKRAKEKDLHRLLPNQVVGDYLYKDLYSTYKETPITICSIYKVDDISFSIQDPGKTVPFNTYGIRTNEIERTHGLFLYREHFDLVKAFK